MFDPYHKWLAIPKDQRPPTHYQLLGIAPTEQDAEVIDEAALRQMAHVRAYQIGEHAAESQRILNEISQARTVLLNPERRKAYDQSLAKPAAPAVATAVLAAPPALLPPPVPATAVATRPPPLPRRSAASASRVDDDENRAPHRRGRRARASAEGSGVGCLVAAGVGVIALVLLVVVGALVMWQLRRSEPPPVPPVAQNDVDKAKPKPEPVVLPKAKDPNPPPLPKVKAPEPAPEPKLPMVPVEPPPKPPADPPPAGARTVDLMGLIDLNVDVVEGNNKWQLRDNMLVCTRGSFVPRVQIPYMPPEEYDFTATFVQPKLRNGISMIMPKPGGGTFFWTLGFNRGGGYGIGPLGANNGGTRAGLIQAGRVHTTIVQVRRDRIKGFVDGQMLIDYATDFRNLQTDSWRRMKNDRLLGIGCDDPTTFQRIQIVEVTGNGKAAR